MEDIDTAMQGGCNFPMGPFALLDLVGLDTSLSILDALYAEFRDPNYAAVPTLRRMVAAGQLGRKTEQGFYDVLSCAERVERVARRSRVSMASMPDRAAADAAGGCPPPTPADDDGIVGVGADLEPGTLLAAYRAGLFPMPLGRRQHRLVLARPAGDHPARRARASAARCAAACRRFEVRRDTALRRGDGRAAPTRAGPAAGSRRRSSTAYTPPARARLGPLRRVLRRRRRARRRPLRRAHRRLLRRRVDVPPAHATRPRSRSSASSTGCARRGGDAARRAVDDRRTCARSARSTSPATSTCERLADGAAVAAGARRLRPPATGERQCRDERATGATATARG